MNNLTYFPFERPNYYHGKLLTEEDFVKEQQYLNDKRRLHNRFFHGTGVVAGLRVLMVNEHSFSLEDGLCIDFSGREVMVPSPEVYKLSAIDGFMKMEEDYQADEVYLCIEYDERGKNQSYGAVSNREDKKAEGYHLYLSSEEPPKLDLGAQDYMISTKILFEDQNLKIEQRHYKALVSGAEFKTSVRLLNKGNEAKFSLRITEHLESAFSGEESLCHFNFENILLSRGEFAEQSQILRAKKLDHGSVILQIPAKEMDIRRNDKVVRQKEDVSIEIPVSKDSLLTMLKKDYFDYTMENIVSNNYPRGIYLAKILLVRQGSSYKMEQIIPMPFEQYVYSNSLMAGMIKELERSIASLQDTKPVAKSPVSLAKETTVEKETVETGFLEIPLSFPAKAGQVYFSHEIYHSLGTGLFDVSLASQEKDILYAGDDDIFGEKKVKAKFAVKQNIKTASFVVGVKLLESSSEDKITLRYVLTKREEDVGEEVHMSIIPSKLELRRGEMYPLEAICHGVPGATILWSVEDKNGGSVAPDGTYTAPNHEGVFEVIALCQQNPNLRASLFILVRE